MRNNTMNFGSRLADIEARLADLEKREQQVANQQQEIEKLRASLFDLGCELQGFEALAEADPRQLAEATERARENVLHHAAADTLAAIDAQVAAGRLVPVEDFQGVPAGDEVLAAQIFQKGKLRCFCLLLDAERLGVAAATALLAAVRGRADAVVDMPGRPGEQIRVTGRWRRAPGTN